MPLVGRKEEDDFTAQLARLYGPLATEVTMTATPPMPEPPGMPRTMRDNVMAIDPLLTGPRPVEMREVVPYAGSALGGGSGTGQLGRSAGARLVQNADVAPPMPAPPEMPHSVQENVVAIDPLLEGPKPVAMQNDVYPTTTGVISTGHVPNSGFQRPSSEATPGHWEVVHRGGGLAGKAHDENVWVPGTEANDVGAFPDTHLAGYKAPEGNHEPSFMQKLIGAITGDPTIHPIGEPKKKEEPFGPPPPPKFTAHPEAKKPAVAATGGGGSASAKLAVSGNAGPGGPDWDSPYYTGLAGLNAKAMAEEAEQQAINEGQGNKAALLALQQAEMERVAKDRDDILARHEAEIDRMAKEAAAGKIDTDRWWKNQSTPQRIMYGLAAALSGFGAGLKGQVDNSILDMIQHSIDQDINAQKEDILNQHKGVEHAQGLLADLYHRFGRLDMAENAARQVAIEEIEAKMKQLVTGAKSDQAKANALIVSGDLDEKRQEHIYAQWALATKLAAQMAMRRMKGAGGVNSKAVEKFGAAVQRLKLGARGEAIGNVDRDLKQGGAPGATGLSGWAAGQKWIPDFLLKDEWIRNRADADVAKNQAVSGLGGRVSKSTVELAAKQYGRGSEEGLRHGNELARRALEKDWNSLVAQFGPQVAMAYLQNDPENLAELLGMDLGVGGTSGGGGTGGGGGGTEEDDLVHGYDEEEK